MKRILGLDLGTNSIGWALVEQNFKEKKGKIIGLGSRIIPMDQKILGDFGKGNSISQTAERTNHRGVRRLRQRHLLRRERLHRVLNIMNFLPEHYSEQIDFKNRLGQFLNGTEPKIAYYDKNFIFKTSFEEMLKDFRQHQPDLLHRENRNGEDAKIPYDWTIYYLRKKALTQKIEKEELAWIILNFNQKRGYYQLRGEEEAENPNKLVEFYSLRVIDIEADEETNKKGEKWYSLTLENGWIYRRSSKTDLSNWKDKVKDFIVTTDLNDDGTIKKDKEGEEKRSFRSPKEDDWNLIKKKTESELEKHIKAHKNLEGTVGTYIYENLLRNPNQKIKGKLVRTIERKFYKDELKAILEKQVVLQPELFGKDGYADSVHELYKNNKPHQLQLLKRDFIHLLLDDIIFYQRPLKSQKFSINNCSLEFRKYRDKEQNEHIQYLKAIPKSNPYYQEFRVWQWLYNLKIFKKSDDTDITFQFINGSEDLENLFEFLMKQKEVKLEDILSYFIAPKIKKKYPNAKGKVLKNEALKESGKYRWNYVYDIGNDETKTYPMNETGYEIRRRLNKVENIAENFLTREIEQHLWHIIYSVTDKIEFKHALETFANNYKLDRNSFVDNFKKFKPFNNDYGRYSEKAIKKLLPLMRIGKYWNWDEIHKDTKAHIDKIITGEYDDKIKNRVREKAINLKKENQFQGLQLWLAQYIIYNRHSESHSGDKWSSINDLEQYLKDFRQHSLRNPIVEQIITETLRVVKDIWKQYGKGTKDYFDEIHIELGREMKNTAEKRKHLTDIISKNENSNLRIKNMLLELKTDDTIENVRPYSPMQQQALKIYEDGVLNSGIDIPDDIDKISKKSEPTKAEIQRYKLWIEQKYQSPYTGQPIPLSKLFTTEYEIEHIIPQSRYFDDSFNNKVICESAVNRRKDKQLGREFIKNHHGEKIECGQGRIVEIFSENAYEYFVKERYAKNLSKRNKLLLDEIPDKMIERQLNDTRYISKFVSNLLSNIVRSEKDDEGINSKNVVPFSGKITGTLKHDWGLNDIWNELILPRFERMNELTKSNDFTSWNERHQKFLPTIPLEHSKGFQKKRIDHRHHALDALVIACGTSEHVNLLNNQYAKSKNVRHDLQKTLRNKEKWQDNKGNLRDKYTEFKKPWKDFTVNAKSELEKVVVSFKQNLRVINKATNYYKSYKDENGSIRVDKNGKPQKGIIKQKGVNWAIRKPMHKEMVYGKVNLPRIKTPKNKVLTAIREPLNTSFTSKRIASITDTGIQKILINHLEKYDDPKINIEEECLSKKIEGRISRLKEKKEPFEHPELAFSPEGVEDMNKNIISNNDGKFHHPIFKVRVFEIGRKFPVGYRGNKKDKYVEAAKGTNLFFAIYKNNETEERMFDTIPLNEAIEHQKLQHLESIPKSERVPIATKRTIMNKGNEVDVTFLFTLSPDDLVYVPFNDENSVTINFNNLSKEQLKRLYNVNDFSSACYFTPNRLANAIIEKEVDMEYDEKKNKIIGSFDTKTASLNGIQIKDICIKLKVDRLGNISIV